MCNKCGHIRHCKLKCRGGAPPPKLSGKKQNPGKGKKKIQGKKGHTNLVDVDEYDGQYDEIDIHFINVKPDLSFTDDPDEIKMDDVAKPRKTEAYTIVHLPTSCEGKTNPSVYVKVETRVGGNVMPLRVFKWLYPNQINMKGEPTGLEPSGTCLTTYNGTPIPQYGALRCPLIWRPGNGVRSRWIQTKWYVADTPGPAILGLPTSEGLRVITLNCTVWITHETPALPNRNFRNANHGVVRHFGTVPHPVATPKGRIISKDQLFKEYPDYFEGIGRFPGNHKIHLKDGVRPVIHPQQKWPIAMQEKLKAKLQETEQK